ncbi:MAG: RnfABCDGE type electron transport complex subunit G [Spongiibacteraceae bacterium]
MSIVASAAATLVILVGTHALLRDRIAANQHHAALSPLLAAFPVVQRQHITLQIAGSLDDTDALGLRASTPFYRAFDGEKLIGWLIPAVARQGYNGDISLVTAINPAGEIIGTQVLDQRETAGLGDRIDRAKSKWLDTFNGHSLSNPSEGAWYVTRDSGRFDAITGATVTSRAVIQAIRYTLLYFQEHRTDFLAAGDAQISADSTHE